MAELKPILLVTSRFATLDFVHNTLTAPDHNYEVRTVASAEEAILALRRSSYSLLVSEQQLPGISGAEMAQRVKKMEPRIPIVVIAEDSEQRRQVAAAEIESVFAVEQPLTQASLIATVRMALQKNEVGYGDALAQAQPVVSPAEPDPAQARRQASAQVWQKSAMTDATPEPVTQAAAVVSAAVRGRLELLHADTGANQVMLATMGGEVLHLVGAQQANGLAKMASAVAANMAGSFDLAEILDSAEPLAIHYQAGEEWELLCANVGTEFALAILFPAKSGRGQIGTAWIFTRRAVNDLSRLLAESLTERTADPPPDDEAGPGSHSALGRKTARAEKPTEALPAGEQDLEDLDRFWEDALSGTATGEDAPNAITLEEARRLGLVPPDFDLDNQ
jgi:DNA-binding response OmpR family regulator